MPSSTSRKVAVFSPKEDWIIDRLHGEFVRDNSDFCPLGLEFNDADVIWLLGEWAWREIPLSTLYGKKVLCTVHHVVPQKFGMRERMDFEFRDRYITAYHVPNKHTEAFIRPLTQKPIHVIPYWANQKIWYRTGTSEELRAKHKLPPGQGDPNAVYLVGSFQRDTEGSDLISPKLEKGPDLLADAIITYSERCRHLFQLQVVLAGWRRQYLMKRLDEASVNYYFFEKPPQSVINDLYQCLNLYPITARQEGGPQSLLECGLLGVPVVSRDMGMASQVLPDTAIADDVTTATPTVPNVSALQLPNGYATYRNLIEAL